MYTFLLVLLVLDSILLIVAVLLQSGKGGGLAASFGGASTSSDLIGSRQAGNLLTKTSWTCGGVFLFLAFVLQIMSARNTVPRSVLDAPLTQTPAAAPPTSGAAPTTAVPLTPAEKGPDTSPPAPKQ